ncbi:MAG: GlxA family transcriptional regulator [Hyphomonadaceae bacterium]
MNKTVAVLIYPDFQLLDAAGPIGAFEMPMRMVSPSPYRLEVIAMEPGVVRSSSGAGLEAVSPGRMKIDTLIVAGGAGSRTTMRCAKTLAFVRKQARSARRVCSVCSGAFILAAAGVLDGKDATTHWGASAGFQRRFPNVNLKPDRIHVRDGSVWTSAGITAGIDLSLALIADDLGEEAARATAQQLVVYYRRPGGQSQFSPLVEFARGEGRFEPLLSWMREHIDEPLHVETLARRAGMSPRNFARAFVQETGVTPARAVERMRLDLARERVERGGDSMSVIARETGFSDPDRMRRAFLRAFGGSPQALRQLAVQH